jgi:hypothetical protein
MVDTSGMSQTYREILESTISEGVIRIPTVDDAAGEPVSVPAVRPGTVTMCFGLTEKKLYIYDGTNWLASAAFT